MRTSTSFGLVLLAFVLLGASGCCSFNREWKQAVAQPPPPDHLAGPWEGAWSSDANGHTDRLRCLVTKQADGRYEARYYAWYRKGITFNFSYTVPLEADVVAGRATFSGEADLGWLAGGVYTYRGWADGTNFFSTYYSKYDNGTFSLQRPK